MPIYEYQGQQYDIATDDHAVAKDKILNYINLQKQPEAVPQPAKPVQPAGPEILPEDDTSSDFMRGIKNALPGIKSTYGAAKVLAGKTLGNKELMASGVEGMKEAETQQKVKASDEFTEAWKQGIGSVLTDWLPYQVGSGLANLAETAGFTLAGAGLGAVTGAGVGAIPGALEGTVAKTLIKKGIKDQAEKLIKEGAKDEAEKLIKNSAKSALIGMGSTLGQAGQAVMHGAGETTGRALSELEQQGKTAEDLNLSKLLPAAGVHSVADFLANKFLMQGAKGLNLKGLSTESTGNLFYDVTKAIASTGAKELLPEEVQTMAERYGASLSLTDAEALKDYINTGAASVAMSIAPGGIGGVHTRLAGKIAEANQSENKTNLDTTSATTSGTTLATAPALLGPDGKPVVAPESTTETKQEETIPPENIAETKTNEPEVIPGALQTANEYIAKIDAGQKIKQSEYRQVANALGLKIPVGTKNVDGVQIIRDYLAKQGEQNDGTITEPNRVSPEVSEQRETGAAAEGATGIDNGRVGGSDIIEEQPGTGTKVQSTTLEDPDQKLQNALEKQAEENEKVEKQSVADLEKNTKKQIGRGTTDTGQGILVEDKKIAKPIKYVEGYKETKDPSSLNYLNQNSYYGLEAPLTIEQGLENAGHEEAFDNFDAVSYEKDIKPILKEKADAINKQRAEQRQAILNKEGRYSAATEAEAKTAANQIKDVSDEKPLEFMTLDELEELYRSKIDKNLELEGKQSRKNAAANRQKFIEGLTPFQKLQVEKAEKEAFRKEVESTTSLGPTKTSDKRKNREAALEGRRLKAEQEIKEQLSEDEAEAAAEKEISRRKPLLKEAPVVQVSARVRSNIEKAVNENDAEKVLSAIADDREMTFGKRVASAFKDLVKTFGDLKIEFGNIEDNGQFNPANNTVTLKGENGVYTGERDIVETVLHETGHYLTDHVVDNKEEYIKSLPKEQQPIVRAALNRLDNNYRYAKSKLGDKFNIPTIKEFIAETYSNPKFQEALANLDTGQPMIEKVMEEQREIVGTKETRYMAEREREIPGPPKRQYAMPKESLFQKIVKNIASVFGFEIKGEGDLKNKPTAAVTLKETLEDIARIISLPTANIRGKEISRSATLTAEDIDNGSILPNKDSNSIKEKDQPKNMTYFKKLFFTRAGWRKIGHAVQNDRIHIKHWQDINDLRNKIYYAGKDKINNIYGQLVRAPAQGMNLYKALVEDKYQIIDKEVYNLSKATGYDIKDTLELLHNVAVGKHDYERRLIKYLKIAPLDDTKKDFTYDGKKITAADFREIAFNKLNKNTTTEAEAKQLRAELNAIVFTKDSNGELSPNTKYVNEFGASPKQITKPDGARAGIETNIDSNRYDVSVLSYAAAKQRVEEFDKYEHKKLIQEVLNEVKKLHEATTELNKMANYWSQPVTNHVAFYGWDNYVPLVGMAKNTEEDELLDFNSKRMGRELQDMAHSFEGRITESDNAILQSMTDAVRASMRAGRKDLTQSIKNAAAYDKELNPNGQGLLRLAKVIEHITFEERRDENLLAKLPREKTVFHYNEDGSIDIIEIGDPQIRESIRRTFKITNPMVDLANNITSRLGMMHTRYNYNFAPLNFVRDTLTNAWAIGAEMGPLESAKFIADIATRVVVHNSLGKALKIASLYESKNYKQIEALANSNDPVIRDMYEFIEKGGMVSYLQGLSLKSNYQQLQKEVGRSGIMRSVAQLNKFVDIWTDMFEISSRSAAYAIAKKNFQGKGLTSEEASNKAVEYAKNLANFEQVGAYGKELGAIFMFFRPSATGAVRAIESLAPAFQKTENIIKDLPPNINAEDKAAFIANFNERQRNARYMVTALMGLGAFAYTMSVMMAGDDDLGRNKVYNDNPDQWTRFARFFTPFGDNPIQLPWGFGLGSFAAAGAQLAMVGAGHQSFGAAMGNILAQISLDSFIPIPVSRMPIQDDPALWALDSLTPSMFRPALEFVVNKNGLGQSIYNDSNRKMGDAYLGGDNIPEIYKDISRGLFDASLGAIDWSPNSIYFLSNSYMDGPGRVIESVTNGIYLASGQAEEKELLARAKGTPLIGSFIGAVPNVDSREFSSVEKQIKEKERVYKQAQLKPEVEVGYLEKHPFDPELIDFYNERVNAELKDLRQQANEIRLMQGLSPKERTSILKSIIEQENIVKYELIQQFKAYGVNP